METADLEGLSFKELRAEIVRKRGKLQPTKATCIKELQSLEKRRAERRITESIGTKGGWIAW